MSQLTRTHSRQAPDYIEVLEQSNQGWKFTVNLGRAPRPTKYYTAEFCHIERSPSGNYLLSFSDYNPATREPNHTLIVQFSDVALLSLWETCINFLRLMKSYTSDAYGETPSRSNALSSLNHTLSANMAFIGQRESEVIFAFYNFSPRTAGAIGQGQLSRKDDWIDPVVEIQTTVRSSLPFFADMERHVEELKKTHPNLQQILIGRRTAVPLPPSEKGA